MLVSGLNHLVTQDNVLLISRLSSTAPHSLNGKQCVNLIQTRGCLIPSLRPVAYNSKKKKDNYETKFGNFS